MIRHLLSGFLVWSMVNSASVQAADWESVKETAKAFGAETIEFAKESWHNSAEIRKSFTDEVAGYADKAKEEGQSLLDHGRQKWDELIERATEKAATAKKDIEV